MPTASNRGALNDEPIDIREGDVRVTTDRSQISLDEALNLLNETHWGEDMEFETLQTAVENSLTFGLFEGTELVGFGRAITDLATFAYLTDVVVADGNRGRGLGRFLVRCILEHPRLQNLRRIALLTSDAEEFYSSIGFTEGSEQRRYMEQQ